MSRIGVPTFASSGAIVLPDKDGTSKFEIKNNLGFVVASIDSQGNIRHRGKIGRTSRP